MRPLSERDLIALTPSRSHRRKKAFPERVRASGDLQERLPDPSAEGLAIIPIICTTGRKTFQR